uniref:Serine aminopeptidase S33 domain-containing protein n=1 Tax=Kalanchoe fedtschenkoi TaxID=63787 RepID=A0A7N0V059_KALFE
MEESEQPEPRRRLHFWGNTPEQAYYASQQIQSSSSFYTSPRGLSLFTRSWQPLPGTTPIRGLVFMIHGYGNDISWTFQATPIFLAQHGFACFALDLEGHGRSDGLKAFVPNVNLVVEDCVSFFTSVKQNPDFQNLPAFLFGESMGGAICLLIHLRNPNSFTGAVLIAPMCKISDKVKPKFPIPQILTALAKLLPTLPIVPTADLLVKSVKVDAKKLIAAQNPNRYTGKPRLGTVLELLRVTDLLSRSLSDVTLPFLVAHGSADAVTDPEVSVELYETAASEDKTIRIYDGMMHSLLFGETDENVETVRRDVLQWLIDRSTPIGGS